jgi:putative ABC transport system permease protein
VNLARISLRNMRVRMLSTCLTVGSIALGAALLAIIWIMVKEAKARYNAATSVVSYSLVVGPKEGSGLELVLNTVFNYGVSQGIVPYSTYKELHDGKMRTRGMVIYAIPQCRGDSWREYPIIGTTDEMFLKFRTGRTADKKPIHLKFAEGGPFEFDHGDFEAFVARLETRMANGGASASEPIPPAMRKAVIGSHVARRYSLKVGSKIIPVHGVTDDPTAHEHAEAECEIVGVLQRTGTPLDRSVYIPIGAFLSMDKHDAVRPGQEQEKNNVGLSAIIVGSARQNAAQRLRWDFQTRTDAQGVVPFYEIIKLLSIIGKSSDVLEVLSYIVLLVTASSVLLGLYNTMNERRREIAIMRALGARRSQILRIILQEALFISLCAGVLGVALCHAALFVGSSYIEAETGISVDWAAFTLKELALVAGVGVLGSLAGILPAVEGSRVPVAENLGPTS